MKKLFVVFIFASILGCVSTDSRPVGDKSPVFYYFHSENCPHCVVAKPFIDSLEKKYPQVEFRNLEVTRDLDARDLYKAKVEELKIERGGVPLFVMGKDFVIGFKKDSHEDKIEKMIARQLKNLRTE